MTMKNKKPKKAVLKRAVAPKSAKPAIGRRLIDLDAAARLKVITERSPFTAAPAQVPIPTPELLAENQTPHQRMMLETGEWARKLLARPEFAGVYESMIAIRRMYVVAYRQLQTLLDGVAEKQEMPPALQDFLIQAAAYTAAKPFTEHALMQGVFETVMPWLTDTVDAHTKIENQLIEDEQRETEVLRRKTPVSLGFRYCGVQEAPELQRDRSLTLVGWRNAVLWLADHICGQLPEAGVSVLRLVDQPKNPSAWDVTVPRGDWAGCGDTRTALHRFLGLSVLPKLTHPVDLLLCDDLALASKRKFAGQLAPAAAGDAHRNLRRWCDEAGCALVGLLPLDDRVAPDISGPAYEQLRTFTALVPVTVATNEDATGYRITVGDGTSVFDVSSEILQTYTPRKKIFVPDSTVQ